MEDTAREPEMTCARPGSPPGVLSCRRLHVDVERASCRSAMPEHRAPRCLAAGLLLGTVLAVFTAACGSSTGPGEAANTARPSAITSRASPTSSGSPLTEDLTITGQVAGHAVTGETLTPSLCGKQPSGSFAAGFTTPLGGTVYQVTISISSGYTGPGTYPTANQNGNQANPPVEVILADTKSTAAFADATQPQLVIDAGEMSGTIDGGYVGYEGTAVSGDTGHLTGRWKCG
jgi:hypothetical protein